MKNLFSFLKPKSFRDVLLHLIIVMSLSFLGIVLFFNAYLPAITHQGKTIEVPNLQKKSVEELQTYLDKFGLGYFIQDSTYNPDLPPQTVFLQHPAPGSRVKAGRKIFVSITSAKPPEVGMPDLIGRSVINAEDELNSLGLKVDSVTYVPDLQQNAVLEQTYKGKRIKAGEMIQKGEKVSLVVGDGLGTQEFEVPDLISQKLDEAKYLLLGNNLKVGSVVFDPESKAPRGTVIRQKPDAAETIRIGDFVDIWVSGEQPREIEADTLAEEND